MHTATVAFENYLPSGPPGIPGQVSKTIHSYPMNRIWNRDITVQNHTLSFAFLDFQIKQHILTLRIPAIHEAKICITHYIKNLRDNFCEKQAIPDHWLTCPQGVHQFRYFLPQCVYQILMLTTHAYMHLDCNQSQMCKRDEHIECVIAILRKKMHTCMSRQQKDLHRGST